MKKKQFVLSLVGISMMIVFSFVLQTFLNNQIKTLEIANAMFFLAMFCLICYKNALKPTNKIGPINMTKKYYEKKGELHKYQKLCKTLLIIAISVGILNLVWGLGEIFVIYVKSLFAN